MHADHHAVAGGRLRIESIARAHLLGNIGIARVDITALHDIPEVLIQSACPADGAIEIAALLGGFPKRQSRASHSSIAIGESGMLSLARAIGMEQTIAL